MNTPRKFCVAVLLALSALTVPAFAALFPTPIEQANRESTSRMWAAARAEHAQQIVKFNEQITAARAQYWATYPDKPGAAEARARFAGLLREKDIYFLRVVLSAGTSDFGGVGVDLDGQIRRSAGPEFEAWVNAVKLVIGTLFANGADPIGWVERLQHGPEMAPWEYKRYSLERDWWEFDQVQRIPAEFNQPETYGAYLYYRFKFAQLPKDDPRGDQLAKNATATYARFVELMGKQVVYEAARKVMNAPKTDTGRLVVTAARPVKLGPSGMVEQPVPISEQVVGWLTKPGPGLTPASVRRTSEVEDNTVPVPNEVIGVFANPLVALERLVTQDDDRRYLLGQLSGHYLLRSTNITGPKTQWEVADILYRRLVLAFGEKDVLEASRVVRTATKRLTDLTVMDPKAIGAARGQPLNSVEDIMARKHPRGYLRAALVACEKLDSPAAVDAAYLKLVAENNEEALLETARKRAAKPGTGRPDLTSATELEQIMEWLRNPPVEALVGPEADSPDYLEWKGFTAGAKVSYTKRVWQPGRMGDQLVAGGPNYRYAYQLQSINAESAKLWFTEINYGNYGQERPGHDSEVSYPAKFNLPVNGSPVSSRVSLIRSLVSDGYEVVWPTTTPIQSGEEVVEIAGRKIATRWQSISHTFKPDSWDKDCKLFVKVWTSDAVPTGLVRRIEDMVFPRGHARFPLGAHFVTEWYLASFEGTRAGVVEPNPSSPIATAYNPNASASLLAPSTGAAISTTENKAAPPPGASGAARLPTQPSAPPVPPRTSAPAQSPPTIAPPSLPPAMAAQLELSKRINQLATRAGRAKNELVRMERALAGQGVKPPTEVYAARDRLDRLINETAVAGVRSPKEAEPKLQELEDSVAVIEKYLKLK